MLFHIAAHAVWSNNTLAGTTHQSWEGNRAWRHKVGLSAVDEVDKMQISNATGMRRVTNATNLTEIVVVVRKGTVKSKSNKTRSEHASAVEIK